MRETLLELQALIAAAAELAEDLPRGYREDQIKAALTGSEGDFICDGLPDWIVELLAKFSNDDYRECDPSTEDCDHETPCEGFE